MTTASKIIEIREKTTRTIDRIEFKSLTKAEKKLYKQEARRLCRAGNLAEIKGWCAFTGQDYASTVRLAIKANIEGDATIGHSVKWAF